MQVSGLRPSLCIRSVEEQVLCLSKSLGGEEAYSKSHTGASPTPQPELENVIFESEFDANSS